MDSFIWLFFVAFAVFAVVAIVMYYRAKKKLKEYAASRGFTYTEFDEFNVMGRCRGFPLFNIGHSRKISWEIIGEHRGYHICIFSYRYTTGGGKNQTTHTKEGLLVDAAICLPKLLTMRPEGIFDKIAEVIGFDDIDFEYHEFNKKYYVKCEDRKLAYDFFGRGVIDFMMLLPRPLSMEALGTHFIFSYSHDLPLQFFDRMLDTGTEIFNRLDKISSEKYGLTEESKKYSQAFYEAGEGPSLGLGSFK